VLVVGLRPWARPQDYVVTEVMARPPARLNTIMWGSSPTPDLDRPVCALSQQLGLKIAHEVPCRDATAGSRECQGSTAHPMVVPGDQGVPAKDAQHPVASIAGS